MRDESPGRDAAAEPAPAADAGRGAAEQHPKGTLAIVGIYGLLFALGWLILYLFVFLPRGTITP